MKAEHERSHEEEEVPTEPQEQAHEPEGDEDLYEVLSRNDALGG